jgi:hypothetical protein
MAKAMEKLMVLKEKIKERKNDIKLLDSEFEEKKLKLKLSGI